MKRSIHNLLVCISFIASSSAFSFEFNIPDGFEDFFIYKKQSLKLKQLNGDYRDVELLVSYNTVKLSDDSIEIEKINNTLLDNNIKPLYVDRILADLREGVIVKNNECKEQELSNCVLVPTGENYAFVLDYDSKRLLFLLALI